MATVDVSLLEYCSSSKFRCFSALSWFFKVSQIALSSAIRLPFELKLELFPSMSSHALWMEVFTPPTSSLISSISRCSSNLTVSLPVLSERKFESKSLLTLKALLFLPVQHWGGGGVLHPHVRLDPDILES